MIARRFLLAFAAALMMISPAALAKSESPADTQNIFIDLAKKIVPSVVNISTTTIIKTPHQNQWGTGQDDPFRKFFEDFLHKRYGDGGDEDDEGDAGPPPGSKNGGKDWQPHAMALGTGFIIDANGTILTNNHVVADADEIKVAFTEDVDETPSDGEVIGRDPDLDVAIIKVKTKRDLKPVVFGDSDALEVGEYVIAVGNPFGQGHSVTHGIISAKGRSAPDFPMASYLQTDAPINPGNSGGPLVNLKGQVIGINNAIDQRAQGIGFAIPINVVKQVLPQLKSSGTVARGYIGVLVSELNADIAAKVGAPKDLKAPVVTQVYPGEPADKAGLKTYDVIIDFNKKPIHTSQELITSVTSVTVGQAVPVKVLRNGKDMVFSIVVSKRPGAQQLALKTSDSKKKGKHPQVRIDTGMSLDDITPEIAHELTVPETTKGVVVSSVAYGGPADRAGIIRGDIILEVDRKAIKDAASFYSVVREKKSYLLRVRRSDPQGHEVYSVVVLDLKE